MESSVSSCRAKKTDKKLVPLFPCPNGKVPLFVPESEELISPTGEPSGCLANNEESRNSIQESAQIEAPKVPLFFSPEQLAELADVTPRAIRKVVAEGRIRFQVSTADNGHHKGRKLLQIALDDAFLFYPKAKLAWEAQQKLKAAIAEAEAQEAAKAIQPPSSPEAIPAMTSWQRLRMDARAIILRQIQAMAEAQQISRDRAVDRFIADADAKRLPQEIQKLVTVANARSGKDGSRTLSRRTIQRWTKDSREGYDHLAPKAYRKAVPAWLPLLLSIHRDPQKRSLAWAVQSLAEQLPPGMKVPSYDTVRRAMAKVGAVEQEKGRMLPRELKHIKPFRRREKPDFPFDVIIADGHTFDAEIAHPDHGRPFRPELTVVVDVCTSRVVGWSAWEKENTWAVQDALRQAILFGGIPLIFYTDNGPGYKNDSLQSLEGRLGIDHRFGIPYNSQARGVVERLQKTLWIDLGAKTFQTYVGAQMDREARQIVFKASRKGEPVLPSWRTFVAFMDVVVATYNARPSRACPKELNDTGQMKHLSPGTLWQRHEGMGWMPEGGPLSLDDFRPQEERKVIRGELSLFGNTYFSKELQELHGEQVRIGFDIHDATKVWVYRLDGTFVCEAGFEANKSAYFPKPYVEALREQRQEGQRKRLAAKQERVLGEPLEPVEIRDLTPEALEASQAQLRKLGVLPSPPADVPPVEPDRTQEALNFRPAFKNDREYNLWVIDHPELADPEELQPIMVRLMKDQFFRMLLGRDCYGMPY